MTLLLVFLIVFVFDLLNGAFLLKRLELSHNEVWRRMGEPSLMDSNVGRPRLRLARFVWMQEFRALKDKTLTALCVSQITLEIALGLIAIAWFV